MKNIVGIIICLLIMASVTLTVLDNKQTTSKPNLKPDYIGDVNVLPLTNEKTLIV